MTARQAVRSKKVHTSSGLSSTGAIEGCRSQEQALWDALNKARTEQEMRPLARVEDAVFRHYLPMAHELAHRPNTAGAAGRDVEDAAELGLAEAVLAWRHRESAGFDRFARAAITHRLRSLNRSGRRTAGESRFAHFG